MKRQKVLRGDCLEVLKNLPDNSVDAVVTDPPYGLGTVKSTKRLLKAWMRGEDGSEAVGKSGFMGKNWDACVPPPVLWEEVLRVLKPGGFLLVFSGTRTQDLMGLALRLAGAQPRNVCAWVYSQGFPKSVDVSKMIDKELGAERKKIRYEARRCNNPKSIGSGHGIEGGDRPWMKKAQEVGYHEADDNTPVSPEAQQWDGWQSDLKPAFEPILMMRKPPSEKTLAANILKWGTGGINADACRIGNETLPAQHAGKARIGTFENEGAYTPERTGRFPSNLMLDETMARVIDEQTGYSKSAKLNTIQQARKGQHSKGDEKARVRIEEGYDDDGFGSRFFYVAKASPSERSLGLEDWCDHPTMKPIELMRYLVRMVTHKDGVVLDPFCGSGTTGCACAIEGFKFMGIEQSKKFVNVARQRIKYFKEHKHQYVKKMKIVEAAKDVKATPAFARTLFTRDADEK